MALRNIALIGANGKLGPAVLRALLFARIFNVSVISRASSKSTYSAQVHVITVPDAADVADLTKALQGQDALVITMAGNKTAEQVQLADACFAAGVKRVIPADFGSCDSADDTTVRLLALYAGKQKVRQHLQMLAEKPESTLSWTSIVCGHFFDYGLESGLLNFDLTERKADIVDGGDIKWSATTLETIGLSVARVVENEVPTKNRLLYIQSVCVTQNQVLEVLERITATKWTVEQKSSRDVIAQNRQKADQGDPEAIEAIVEVHGLVAANWEDREDFANDLLGLKTENLSEIVGRIVSP